MPSQSRCLYFCTLSSDDRGYSEPCENVLKNNYLKKVRKKYWSALFNNPEFTKLFTSNLQRDFYNKRHTNLVGSEKVTEFVGNYIMENYNLNTEHSEEVKADWNKMLEVYNIQAEEAKAKIASRK